MIGGEEDEFRNSQLDENSDANSAYGGNEHFADVPQINLGKKPDKS